MTVLKQYNTGTSHWEPIVTGAIGPTGATGPTGASGPLGIISSATAPVSPSAGQVWFNTTTGSSYIYYNSAWVELGGGSMSPLQATSSTRPSAPWTGQTIYETDTNRFYLWNGTAWVIPNSPAQNPSGLELITTATCSSGGTASGGVITIGSAVGSVTVANAFSATYDNYKVVVSGGTTSAQTSISMVLGAGAGSYYGIYSYASYSVGTPLAAMINNATSFIYAGGADIALINCNIELQNPFLAKYTNIQALTVNYANNRGHAVGEHEIATSYTAFTLAPFTGTLTGGTIRVYGYRNS